MSNIPIPSGWPRSSKTLPTPMRSDATVAISESALTKLVRLALDNPVATSGGGGWGPFVASYAVNLQITGGDIKLTEVANVQIVRLSNVIVRGSVNLSVGLDLGRVLPHICIPPFRVCLHTPWGDVCTPQVCIPWPSIQIPIPIPIPPLGLSADFGVGVQQRGASWQVDLNLYPFSLYIDLTPTVDLIIDTAKAFVRDTIGRIPLVGGLLEGLVDTVLNALRSVLDAILTAIKELIRTIILGLDLFSPTIPVPIQQIPARQIIMPASGPGDGDVALNISAVSLALNAGDLVLALSFS
jgi:hypothetical protein